jgi:hypothetical protein
MAGTAVPGCACGTLPAADADGTLLPVSAG